MSDLSGGQIVGGIVGGVIGFIAGGPMGAAYGVGLGMGIGGYIDPPQGPNFSAPQIGDQKYQSAAYGTKIPNIYGAIALFGNVIYLENGKYKKVVTKIEQDGKGGGGSTTSESVEFFATFAISLCEKVQGSVVARVWIGGKLFYNSLESGSYGSYIQSYKNSQMFRYYDGSQTEPDDRIESVLGVGNAPSYEGTAYIVFYDLPLSEYGNGLAGAQVKVEIITDPVFSVEQFMTTSTLIPYPGIDSFSPTINSIHQFYVHAFNPHWSSDYPSTMTRVDYGISNNDTYTDKTFTFSASEDGNAVPPTGLNPDGTFYMLSGHLPGVPLSVGHAKYPEGGYQIRSGLTFVYSLGDIHIAQATGANYYTISLANCAAVCIDESGLYVYAADDTTLYKYTASLSLVSSVAHGIAGVASSNIRLWHDAGVLYLCKGETTGFFYTTNDDLSLSPEFKFSIFKASSVIVYTFEFVVENGVLTHAWVEDGGGGDRIIKSARYSINSKGYQQKNIGEIVTSKALQAGVDASRINVDSLDGITTNGYKTSGGSVRSAISQLQAAFMFDVIQSGYGLTAIKRGSDPIATISYDDLGASNKAGDTRLKRSREMDTQLPSRYTINYLDIEREYDVGTQYADYPTSAQNERTEEFAIVFSPDEAAQLVDVLINLSWVERDSFSFDLPQTYLFLNVTDVVTVQTPDRDYVIRLESRNETQDQIISFTGKLAEPALYQSNAVGAGGTIPDDNVALITESNFIPIDAPMLYDVYDIAGYGGAMYGESSWAGGILYRSVDGGQSYTAAQAFLQSAAVGIASDVIDAHDGFTIDRVSALNITIQSGEFPAVTETQMMTGSNWCAYGIDGRWELIRYANATLQTNGSVTIDTLVRGAKGTEWATGLHDVDDYIILISESAMAFIGTALETVGIERLLKSVTTGDSIANAAAQSFTYNAVNLKPLSPVLAVSELKASNGDTDITCTPRTRYSDSFWVTGVQPQNEPDGLFEIDILDGSTVVRTLSGVLPIRYSGAAQVEDFGSTQSVIDIAIYHMSSRAGRGFPLSASVTSLPLVLGTWDSTIDTGALAYSNNNLTIVNNGSEARGVTYSTVGQTAGKFVFEITCGYCPNVIIGLANTTYKNNVSLRDSDMGSNYNAMGFRTAGGVYYGGSYDGAAGFASTAGDILTFMIDLDANTATMVLNNNADSETVSIASMGAGKIYIGTSLQTATTTITLELNPNNMTYAASLFPDVLEIGYNE